MSKKKKPSSKEVFDNQGTRRTQVRAIDDPVYGLWVWDGGMDGRGAWMCDSTCHGEFPAIFFDCESAESAAKEERKHGLAIVVYEMRATHIVSVPYWDHHGNGTDS